MKRLCLFTDSSSGDFAVALKKKKKKIEIFCCKYYNVQKFISL